MSLPKASKRSLWSMIITLLVGSSAFIFFHKGRDKELASSRVDIRNLAEQSNKESAGLSTSPPKISPGSRIRTSASNDLAGPGKEALLALLKGVRSAPPILLALKFDPTDEATLLKMYRQTLVPRDRIGLVFALARIGGEETASAFIYTLTEEFKGVQLGKDSNDDDERAMETITFAMGLVANRSERAMQFIQAGTQSSFWQAAITWKSTPGSEINSLLAGQCITAIGMTGRDEVPPLLAAWEKNAEQGLEGAVVQAAFYNDLRKEKGFDNFYIWLLNRSSSDEFDDDGSYRRWQVTPSGSEWQRWYDARTGIQK